MNILPFGKWRGQSLRDIEISYVLWLLGQAWFKDTYPEHYPAARRRAMAHFAAEVEAEQRQPGADLV